MASAPLFANSSIPAKGSLVAVVSWWIRGVAISGPYRARSAGEDPLGRGLRGGVARAGEREVYWYLSLRADQFPLDSGSSRHAGQSLRLNLHQPSVSTPRWNREGGILHVAGFLSENGAQELFFRSQLSFTF